jgi:hypothetical protein
MILERFRKASNHRLWWIPVAGMLVFILLIDWRYVNEKLNKDRNLPDQFAQEIGHYVDHSTQVVNIARYYGLPLEYMGEFTGTYWPRAMSDRDAAISAWGAPQRSVSERLNTLGFEPEYFVITDFNEFDHHHNDLKEYLKGNCSELASTEKYLIFEQCSEP